MTTSFRFHRILLPVLICLMCSAATLSAETSFSQGRHYPTNAECFPHPKPNEVILHPCDPDKTYYCPTAEHWGWEDYCVPFSPETKARIKREQEAAEAARNAKLAAEAEHRRQVDVETARLGAHRRAEAERLVAMREQAQAARPKPRTPPKADTCRMVKLNPRLLSTVGNTQAQAQAQITSACSGAGATCGPVTCGWQSVGMGSNLGTYQCSTQYTGVQKVCDSGPGSKVTGQ